MVIWALIIAYVVPALQADQHHSAAPGYEFNLID
jgi:hypothetical protein